MWNTRALFFTYFGICLWILSGGGSEQDVRRRSLDQAKFLLNNTCISCKGLVLKKEDQTVNQGGRVTLKCTVGGGQPVNVTWWRNGSVVKSSSEIMIRRINGGSRLRIKSAKLIDSGSYLCLADRRNGKREFSNTAHVTVQAKTGSPAVKRGLGNTTVLTNTTVSTKVLLNNTCISCKGLVLKKEDQTVNQGERVTLKCTVGGGQPVNVTWWRNGSVVKSSSEIMIRRINGGSRLRIKSAKLIDSGTYLCLADRRNGKREFSNTAHVTVQAKIHKSSTNFDKTDQQAVSPAVKRGLGNTTVLTNTTVSTNVVHTRQPGYCVPYTGVLCSDYLKKPYQKIYLDHNSPQQNIEKKLERAYDAISNSDRLSKQCKPYVLPLLCHFSYPFCDKHVSTPTPRSLCRDECDDLSKGVCSSEYHMAQIEKLMTVLLPNCSKLPPKSSAGWERCISLDIKYPSLSTNPQKVDNCFNGTGESYRGNKSLTEKRYTCQAWNHTKPHFHLFSPSKYPELQGGHNFCRNPGGNKKRPWCYTTDEKILYDYCDIARCDQLPTIKMVSILYMVIPCLVFAIIVASVVILICWRCHKWMMYQAEQASPVLPVIVKTANSPSIKELQREMIVLREGMGEDQFGKVYYGELNSELDCRCVIKTSRSNKREEFINQAVKWSSFNHPNVIKILGMCTEESLLSVVYEYLECGTLHDYLLRHSPLDDPNDCCKPDCLSGSDLLSIAVQVADALNYLANNSYIHGDIATRSCMVGPQRTVKITDISLSWYRQARDYYWEPNKRPMPVRWMAPEGVIHSKFTPETDIWSFGVFLWELFSYGDQPHYGYSDDEVIRRIRDHVILECPADCPEELYSLMKDCWDILPPSRPQFRAIHSSLCTLCDYYNRVITRFG